MSTELEELQDKEAIFPVQEGETLANFVICVFAVQWIGMVLVHLHFVCMLH